MTAFEAGCDGEPIVKTVPRFESSVAQRLALDAQDLSFANLASSDSIINVRIKNEREERTTVKNKTSRMILWDQKE